MALSGCLFRLLIGTRSAQPVKVVSSMGQQSVGKSYSLNHLVDTSFAGSAMRTTGILSQLLGWNLAEIC